MGKERTFGTVLRVWLLLTVVGAAPIALAFTAAYLTPPETREAVAKFLKDL